MSHEKYDEEPSNFTQKHRKSLWKRAKKQLRRNVKLRIKAGKYDDLREKPRVDESAWYDDGY